MKNALWQTVLGEIELSVSRASFMTWFKNTELMTNEDGNITIGVPNIFAKQQLEIKFTSQITDILKKNGVTVQSLQFAISSSVKKPRAAVEKSSASAVPSLDYTATEKPAPASRTALNPKYTFDTFIVGSSNELAYTACLAVAKEPGTKYNPLFLYGGVGLGKTHLMQAVGNEVGRKKADARILYISCETFVQDFMDHIRFKKKGFADRYRNVDVLIVDDMQFIAGKEKTQEEFFHTFNALHQANKQIILSSDKPPKAIPTLEELSLIHI